MYTFMQRIPYIPEEWRRISEYLPEVQDYYMISNKGVVCSLRWKETKYNVYSLSNTGYYQVSLSLKCKVGNIRKTYLVHRLVMMCFDPINQPQKYQVNHMLGIKTVNEQDVLEWCTDQENVLHAFNTGLAPRGELRYNTIFTNEQVHEICKYLEMGMPYKDIIFRITGISDPSKSLIKTFRAIKYGYNWKEISSQYKIDNTRNYSQIFTKEQAIQIYNCCKDNMDNEDIMLLLKYDINNLPIEVVNKLNKDINSIRNGFGYRNLIKEDINK